MQEAKNKFKAENRYLEQKSENDENITGNNNEKKGHEQINSEVLESSAKRYATFNPITNETNLSSYITRAESDILESNQLQNKDNSASKELIKQTLKESFLRQKINLYSQDTSKLFEKGFNDGNPNIFVFNKNFKDDLRRNGFSETEIDNISYSILSEMYEKTELKYEQENDKKQKIEMQEKNDLKKQFQEFKDKRAIEEGMSEKEAINKFCNTYGYNLKKLEIEHPNFIKELSNLHKRASLSAENWGEKMTIFAEDFVDNPFNGSYETFDEFTEGFKQYVEKEEGSYFENPSAILLLKKSYSTLKQQFNDKIEIFSDQASNFEPEKDFDNFNEFESEFYKQNKESETYIEKDSNKRISEALRIKFNLLQNNKTEQNTEPESNQGLNTILSNIQQYGEEYSEPLADFINISFPLENSSELEKATKGENNIKEAIKNIFSNKELLDKFKIHLQKKEGSIKKTEILFGKIFENSSYFDKLINDKDDQEEIPGNTDEGEELNGESNDEALLTEEQIKDKKHSERFSKLLEINYSGNPLLLKSIGKFFDFAFNSPEFTNERHKLLSKTIEIENIPKIVGLFLQNSKFSELLSNSITYNSDFANEFRIMHNGLFRSNKNNDLAHTIKGKNEGKSIDRIFKSAGIDKQNEIPNIEDINNKLEQTISQIGNQQILTGDKQEGQDKEKQDNEQDKGNEINNDKTLHKGKNEDISKLHENGNKKIGNILNNKKLNNQKQNLAMEAKEDKKVLNEEISNKEDTIVTDQNIDKQESNADIKLGDIKKGHEEDIQDNTDPKKEQNINKPKEDTKKPEDLLSEKEKEKELKSNINKKNIGLSPLQDNKLREMIGGIIKSNTEINKEKESSPESIFTEIYGSEIPPKNNNSKSELTTNEGNVDPIKEIEKIGEIQDELLKNENENKIKEEKEAEKAEKRKGNLQEKNSEESIKLSSKLDKKQKTEDEININIEQIKRRMKSEEENNGIFSIFKRFIQKKPEATIKENLDEDDQSSKKQSSQDEYQNLNQFKLSNFISIINKLIAGKEFYVDIEENLLAMDIKGFSSILLKAQNFIESHEFAKLSISVFDTVNYIEIFTGKIKLKTEKVEVIFNITLLSDEYIKSINKG